MIKHWDVYNIDTQKSNKSIAMSANDSLDQQKVYAVYMLDIIQEFVSHHAFGSVSSVMDCERKQKEIGRFSRQQVSQEEKQGYSEEQKQEQNREESQEQKEEQKGEQRQELRQEQSQVKQQQQKIQSQKQEEKQQKPTTQKPENLTQKPNTTTQKPEDNPNRTIEPNKSQRESCQKQQQPQQPKTIISTDYIKQSFKNSISLKEIVRSITNNEHPLPTKDREQKKSNNKSKLLTILQFLENKPKNISIPTKLKSASTISFNIRQMFMGMAKACCIVGEDDTICLYDIDEGKITTSYPKNGNRTVTSAFSKGQGAIFAGFVNGSLIKLIPCLTLQPHGQISLHDGQITGICSFKKYIYTSGVDQKLIKIETSKLQPKQRNKICQPLTNLTKIDIPQVQHIIFGVNLAQTQMIMYDEQIQMATTLFAVDQCSKISQIITNKEKTRMFVSVSKRCPQIYEIDPYTFELTLRVRFNTLHNRKINMALFLNEPIICVVIATNKIYYYNTETWKLAYKHTSEQKNKQYICLSITKKNRVFAGTANKSVQIYTYNCDAEVDQQNFEFYQ